MNLRSASMLGIAAAAGLCLLLSVAAMVWQDRQGRQQAAEQRVQDIARRVTNQLQWQAGLRGGFNPGWGDLGDLLEGGLQPGDCAVLLDRPTGAVVQRRCIGGDAPAAGGAPAWFRQRFDEGRTAAHPITARGGTPLSVVIETDAGVQAARLWERLAPLVTFSVVTSGSLFVLACLVLRRVLRPLDALLAAMARLETGTAGARLPRSRIREFDRIAAAFNHLAESLERRTAERDALTRRLINVQEEERRHLARELHDEFGQSLTAIGAVAASIAQGAESVDGGLAGEARRIQEWVEPMMRSLRDLLLRLRPPGLDEFGLEACLRSLAAQCSGRGRVAVEVEVTGDFSGLDPSAALGLFRVAQESLTNVMKHAAATRVMLRLRGHAGAGPVELTVEDDGRPLAAPSSTAAGATGGVAGFGLAGMRERMAALGGRLDAAARQPQGFRVQAWLPMAGLPAPQRS